MVVGTFSSKVRTSVVLVTFANYTNWIYLRDGGGVIEKFQALPQSKYNDELESCNNPRGSGAHLLQIDSQNKHELGK